MTMVTSRPSTIPTKPNRPISDPRAAALIVLDRVDRNRLTLDAVLDDAAPMLTALTRRDRALFNQLVYGVLRQRLRLDAVVGAYADRPLVKISPQS
jgi:16S rRNA (cytosine967-C5)-methyltransferase